LTLILPDLTCGSIQVCPLARPTANSRFAFCGQLAKVFGATLRSKSAATLVSHYGGGREFGLFNEIFNEGYGRAQ
jgi:hypothetical protein